jgi:hypothetical protein
MCLIIRTCVSPFIVDMACHVSYSKQERDVLHQLGREPTVYERSLLKS